jgi:hypothetical protein
MEKSIDATPLDEAGDVQAAINAIIEEIDRLRAQMSRDEEEIERSRTRTRAMLSQLAAMRTSA